MLMLATRRERARLLHTLHTPAPLLPRSCPVSQHFLLTAHIPLLIKTKKLKVEHEMIVGRLKLRTSFTNIALARSFVSPRRCVSVVTTDRGNSRHAESRSPAYQARPPADNSGQSTAEISLTSSKIPYSSSGGK